MNGTEPGHSPAAVGAGAAAYFYSPDRGGQHPAHHMPGCQMAGQDFG
jgi:hypothetical protein